MEGVRIEVLREKTSLELLQIPPFEEDKQEVMGILELSPGRDLKKKSEIPRHTSSLPSDISHSTDPFQIPYLTCKVLCVLMQFDSSAVIRNALD